MAVTSTPVFAQTPYSVSVNLTAQTACTTRGPTATASLAGANIIQFVPTSTNGARIDYILVKAASTSITAATAANLVQIWNWDGTTAWLTDEIPVSAVTPSTTAAGFSTIYSYANGLYLPSTNRLYVSLTVTTTASTTALTATAFGALL
jgi:hypothetical protein